MAIVTVNGLSMEFGEQKLFDKMSFEVQNDDRIGLIGVNGCGKTTLGRCIMGLLKPAKDGDDADDKNPVETAPETTDTVNVDEDGVIIE